MPGAAKGGGEPETSGLWGLCCKLTVSRCSLRVGRGAPGGETPALLGQRLSKRLLSTCTIFAMKQQDPDSREQGESQVSLLTTPHGWQRGCQGSLHAAKTGGRGRQELPSRPGAGSLLSSASGARAGLWAPVGAPMPAMPPSSPQAPALPFSQLGRDRAGPWGRSHRDTSPSPAEVLIPSGICSLPSSMHAVSPGRGRPGYLWVQNSEERALCPHVLPGEFSQGSLQLSARDGLFLADLMSYWPSPLCSFLPVGFFRKRAGTDFSLRTPDAQSRRQPRR